MGGGVLGTQVCRCAGGDWNGWVPGSGISFGVEELTNPYVLQGCAVAGAGCCAWCSACTWAAVLFCMCFYTLVALHLLLVWCFALYSSVALHTRMCMCYVAGHT